MVAPMRSLIAELSEFLHWWWAQLVFTTRWLVGVVMPTWKIGAVVVFERTGGEVLRVRNTGWEKLFGFKTEIDSRWPDDLRPFGTFAALKGTRCSAVLSNDLILKRSIPLPDTVEHQLGELLPLYLEREFPISLDEINWSYSVTERTKENRQIAVELTIVRCETVQAVERAVRAWGFKLIQIGVREGDRILGDFRQPPIRASFKRGSRTQRILVASAACLSLVLIGCIGVQWWRERQEIERELAPYLAKAERVRVTSAAMQRKADPAQQLVKIAAQPDAADLVYLLTEHTPVDTWVYQLSINAGANVDREDSEEPALVIEAVTPASLSYLKNLASIPGFGQVELASTEPSPASSSLKRALVKVRSVHLASESAREQSVE